MTITAPAWFMYTVTLYLVWNAWTAYKTMRAKQREALITEYIARNLDNVEAVTVQKHSIKEE